MIYITGDTHGEFTRFGNRHMKAKGLELTDKDCVIICGDFGLCWENNATFRWECQFFEDKPFKVLWVQGNHENYDFISEFEIEEWNGGKVRHIVRDKVILLERGQVFTIEGKTFFTFGGASSHDVQGGIFERSDPQFKRKVKKAMDAGLPWRIQGESWWPQELPSEEEMAEGLRNLAKVNYRVDYVITHCCATKIQDFFDPAHGKLFSADVLTEYFQEIESKLDYSEWYFGHYHMDKRVDEKHILLYKAIIPLGEQKADFSKLPCLGRPKYKRTDRVRFCSYDKEVVGVIEIVDACGTLDQEDEPSYDILCKEENCLYKHIIESEIVELIEK